MAHIGNLGDLGLDGRRTLVIRSTWKTRETFLAKEDREGVNGDVVVSGSEFALDVIDGEIAFAHADGQITSPITLGSRLRPALSLTKEGGTFVGAVTELMAQDTKGTDGGAETASDGGGGKRSSLSLNNFVSAACAGSRCETRWHRLKRRFTSRSAYRPVSDHNRAIHDCTEEQLHRKLSQYPAGSTFRFDHYGGGYEPPAEVKQARQYIERAIRDGGHTVVE